MAGLGARAQGWLQGIPRQRLLSHASLGAAVQRRRRMGRGDPTTAAMTSRPFALSTRSAHFGRLAAAPGRRASAGLAVLGLEVLDHSSLMLWSWSRSALCSLIRWPVAPGRSCVSSTETVVVHLVLDFRPFLLELQPLQVQFFYGFSGFPFPFQVVSLQDCTTPTKRRLALKRSATAHFLAGLGVVSASGGTPKPPHSAYVAD